jgi:hypothetical protein
MRELAGVVGFRADAVVMIRCTVRSDGQDACNGRPHRYHINVEGS